MSQLGDFQDNAPSAHIKDEVSLTKPVDPGIGFHDHISLCFSEQRHVSPSAQFQCRQIRGAFIDLTCSICSSKCDYSTISEKADSYPVIDHSSIHSHTYGEFSSTISPCFWREAQYFYAHRGCPVIQGQVRTPEPRLFSFKTRGFYLTWH